MMGGRRSGKRAAQIAALGAQPGIIVCPPGQRDDLRRALPGRDVRSDPTLTGAVLVYENAADLPEQAVSEHDDDRDDEPFVPLTAWQLGLCGPVDDPTMSPDAARYTGGPAEDVQP